MSLMMPNVGEWLYRDEAARMAGDMSSSPMDDKCVGLALVKFVSQGRRGCPHTGAFLRSLIAKGTADDIEDCVTVLDDKTALSHYAMMRGEYAMMLDYVMVADDYVKQSDANHPRRWTEIVEQSTGRPGQEAYSAVIDGLLDAISDGSFLELDKLFARLDVASVSTDFLVALPSITYENRNSLVEWERFYKKVIPELERRGVDVELELAGLDDFAGASE
jgi:hypothetical protein